jgi:hypothetical protein
MATDVQEDLGASSTIKYIVESHGTLKSVSGDMQTIGIAITREQIPAGSYKLFFNGTNMSIVYK